MFGRRHTYIHTYIMIFAKEYILCNIGFLHNITFLKFVFILTLLRPPIVEFYVKLVFSGHFFNIFLNFEHRLVKLRAESYIDKL